MSIRSTHPRKKPIIYQFNILSLADAKFIRLHFEANVIKPSEIGHALHVARYIVNREQIFARVLFSTRENFPSLLNDFDRLHDANKEILKDKRAEFYSGIEKDQKRLVVLLKEFKEALYHGVLISDFPTSFESMKTLKSANLEWDKKKHRLKILVISETDADVNCLNNSELRPIVAKALKDVYRYEGDFIFDEDVPF